MDFVQYSNATTGKTVTKKLSFLHVLTRILATGEIILSFIVASMGTNLQGRKVCVLQLKISFLLLPKQLGFRNESVRIHLASGPLRTCLLRELWFWEAKHCVAVYEFSQ